MKIKNKTTAKGNRTVTFSESNTTHTIHVVDAIESGEQPTSRLVVKKVRKDVSARTRRKILAEAKIGEYDAVGGDAKLIIDGLIRREMAD